LTDYDAAAKKMPGFCGKLPLWQGRRQVCAYPQADTAAAPTKESPLMPARGFSFILRHIIRDKQAEKAVTKDKKYER